MPQYGSPTYRGTWQVGATGGLTAEEREAQLRGQQRQGHSTWQVSGVQTQVLTADNREMAEQALQRLEAAGITSGSEYERLASIAQTGQPPQGNVLTKILGWLDKPGMLVRYAVADIFDRAPITGQAYTDILLGRKQSLLRRYGAETVGEDPRMSGSQMLTNQGIGQAATGWGKFGRGVVSFGLEFLTDPLSLLTMGAGGATRPVRLAQAAASVGRAADVALPVARRGAAAITAELAGRGEGLAREIAEKVLARQPQTLRQLEEAAAREVFGETAKVGREGLEAVAEMFGGRGAAGFGDDLVEASWAAARKAVADETLDRIAPRILARQFAAPEVENFVRSRYTPAYLRGGLRVSPVPIIGQLQGHAVVIPWTRGMGKKITQTIFGKAGTVVGQKATGLRKLIESGLTPWYRGFEEGMKRWDARSYLRGIMGGHVAASAVLGAETHLAQIVATQGVGKAIDSLRVAYETLAEIGRKEGMSDDQLWRVLAQVPVRLLEDMPADLTMARTSAEALLLREGVTSEPLRRGIVSFMFNYRRIMDEQWDKLVARGILKPGQRIENYVPHRLTPEARQLIADLAETGAEIPTDTWQGQLLAELVSSVRLRKMAGGTIGEAQHAGERVIGSTSTIFESLGSNSETHLLNWRMAAAAAAAGEPDGGMALLKRLGIETLEQAGRPTFRFIREMNDGLERVLRQVVETTQGLSMPKMKGTEVFHLFDENPLSIATAYLRDVNDAVVERSVIEYLLTTGTLEKVAPTLHAERLAHALAQKMGGAHRAKLAADLAAKIADLEKGRATFERTVSKMVKVTVGGVTTEVPEVVLTPKVRRAVERILTPMADTVGHERHVDELTEKLVNRLVKKGVPREAAEAFAHCVEFTGDDGLREVGRAMREAHREVTRAKFDALLQAAIRTNMADEDLERLLRVLQAEVSESQSAVRRTKRALGGILRRRTKRRAVDSAFAEDTFRWGIDTTMDAVHNAQVALGRFQDAEAARALEGLSGREYARTQAAINASWQGQVAHALALFAGATTGYDTWSLPVLDEVVELVNRALVVARHGRQDAPSLVGAVAGRLRKIVAETPDRVPYHVRTVYPDDQEARWGVLQSRVLATIDEAGRPSTVGGFSFNPFTGRTFSAGDWGLAVGGVVPAMTVPWDEWVADGFGIARRFAEQHEDQLHDLGRVVGSWADIDEAGNTVMVLDVSDLIDQADTAWEVALSRGEKAIYEGRGNRVYTLADNPAAPASLMQEYNVNLMAAVSQERAGRAQGRQALSTLADYLESQPEYQARIAVNQVGTALDDGQGLTLVGVLPPELTWAMRNYGMQMLGEGNLVRDAYREVAVRQGLAETVDEVTMAGPVAPASNVDDILGYMGLGPRPVPTSQPFRETLTIEMIEDVRDQIEFVRWWAMSHPIVDMATVNPSLRQGAWMEAARATVPLNASQVRAVERGMRSAMSLDPSVDLRWAKVRARLADGRMGTVVEPQARTWDVTRTGATPQEVADALHQAGMTAREAQRVLLEFRDRSRLPADFPDLRIPNSHPDTSIRGMSLLRGCVMDREGNVVPVFRADMMRAYEEFTGTVGAHPNWATGHDDAARQLPGVPAGYTEIDLFRDGGLAVDRMGSDTPWLRIDASEITEFTPSQRFTLADFMQRHGKQRMELESQGQWRGTVQDTGQGLSAPIAEVRPSGIYSLDEIAGVEMPQQMAALTPQVRDSLLRVTDDLVDTVDELVVQSERLARARLALGVNADRLTPGGVRFGAAQRMHAWSEDVGAFKYLRELAKQRRLPKGFHHVSEAEVRGGPESDVWKRLAAMDEGEREAWLADELAKRRQGEIEGIESLRRGGMLGDEDLKGSYLRDPIDVEEQGGVGYLTREGGGYWVSKDGTTASGIFDGDQGAINMVHAIVGAGCTKAVVHPASPMFDALTEMGWRQIGSHGDQAIMRVVPADPGAVGREVAARAKRRQVLEGLQKAAARGNWDEIEVALQKNRALFRDLPEQVDELREHIAAERLLRDPDIDDTARELVKARRVMMNSRIRRDDAVRRLHDFGRWVADQLATMPGATLRRQLESALALRDIFGHLMDTLASSKPWAEPEHIIRQQAADAVYHARQLGWGEFADTMQKAMKESSTLVAPRGKVLVRAFALSGESVDMVAANPWMGLFLENMVANLQMLNTPIGLRFLAHQARSVENWWKAMATVARPTFHPRNLIGGIWNNQIGGVRMQDYLWVRNKMLRLRHLQRSGKTLDEALATFAEKDRQVIRDFFDTGVSEASFARGDLTTILRPKTRFQRANPLSVHGPLVQGGAYAMESIEDFLRMAAFRRWHAEGGAKVAREWALALHFDYHNLTRFETQVKRFVPFLVWTRRNIPLQMQALVERPDLFARYSHLMHGFDDQSDTDAPYDLPFGSSTGLSIRTNMIFGSGTPFWARAVLSPDLPLNDLAAIENPLSLGSWMNFLASTLGPHVQLPFTVSRSEEIGGSVNAPAGLNQILMAMHGMGLWDDVDEDEGVARIPRTMRQLGETFLPIWSEYGRPFDTDPGRNQMLGLPSGDQGSPDWGDRGRAFAIWLARGVGMRTQTPTQAWSQGWKVREEMQAMIDELERRGIIPPPRS